jgi:Tfp pilus assembly protein PilV
MSRPQRPKRDQGESLIELILAIGILGICVLAIGTSIALSVRMSAIHRNQATADAFLHNYAETLQSSYSAQCGPAATYAAELTPPLGTFQAPVVSVQYWNSASASFGSTCITPDAGLQQVTLTLSTADGTVSESLVVILRTLT